MQRTRLFLFRHGQVEGHEEKRYNGQVNVQLSPLGREQSARIRDCMADFSIDAVYSSDLDRSSYCAGLIAIAHNLEVTTDASLRELHVGNWEGRTWAELREVYPDDWQARLKDIVNFQVPGGESLQDAANRIRPSLERIIEKHAGGNIVLVAHGGVNRILLLDAIGAPLQQVFSLEQDFGCLNIIDYFEGGSSVVNLLNGTSHQEV